LFTAWKTRSSVDAAGLLRWSAVNATLSVALLLVHNNSVALVAANSLVLIVGVATMKIQRTAAAVLTGVVAMTIWIVVRHALGQDHSHVLGFGVGRYAASTYLLQLVRGTGSLIVPDRYGAPIVAAGAMGCVFATLVRRSPGRTALMFVGVFAT